MSKESIICFLLPCMKIIPLNHIGLLKRQSRPSTNDRGDHSLPVGRYSSLIHSLYGLIYQKKSLARLLKPWLFISRHGQVLTSTEVPAGQSRYSPALPAVSFETNLCSFPSVLATGICHAGWLPAAGLQLTHLCHLT